MIGLGPSNIGGSGPAAAPLATDPPATLVQSVTGPATVAITPGALVSVDTNAGAVSLTPPASGTVPVGTFFAVTDAGDNANASPINVGGLSIRIEDPNAPGSFSSGVQITRSSQTVWWQWGPTPGAVNGWKLVHKTPGIEDVLVTNLAALGGVASGAMPSGTVCYVQSVGAYFTLQAASALAPDGITIIAAAVGNWLRGASGIALAAQKQTAWFIDPAAGNDESDGLTSGTPIKHCAEIVRRWGTNAPILAQATTVTWLASGPVSDPWTAIPILEGAGSLRLQGTPTVVQTTTIGAVTAAVQGGANTLATITSPGVASWAALVGTLIHNTTHPSTFFIHADAGAGVAQITQPVATPLAPGAFTPAPVTQVNGDTIQLLTPPTIYVTRLATIGTGTTGGLIVSQLVVKAATIAVTIETIAAAEADFSACVMREVGASASNFASCLVGYVTGSAIIVAGRMNGFASLGGPAPTTLDGNVIVAGTLNLAVGLVWLRAVYFASGSFSNMSGGASVLVLASATYGPSGRGIIWGPSAIGVSNGAELTNNGGTAAQVFQNTGGLLLDGAASGSTYNAATGAWTAAVALTPAALDANVAFINPRTGSRIHL